MTTALGFDGLNVFYGGAHEPIFRSPTTGAGNHVGTLATEHAKTQQGAAEPTSSSRWLDGRRARHA